MNPTDPGARRRMDDAARDGVAAILWRRLDTGDSPIVPFGQLRGTLLCRHRLRDGRMIPVLRELVPNLHLRTGRCDWTCTSIAIDLSRPKDKLGDPLSLKAWHRNLVAMGEVLKERLEQAEPVSTPPILPYTLMALPSETAVQPRATKAILAVAEQRGLFWRDAWQQLADERRVESDLQLIDTRLCDRLRGGLTWPGAMAVYHDLRDVPGEHVWRTPLHGSVAHSLFIYRPHALFDGWNVSEPLMQRLGLEHFPMPEMQLHAAALAG